MTTPGRSESGQFAAGNPGRPKGSINRSTAEMKEFLAPYSEDILRGMLILAIGGEVEFEDPETHEVATVKVPPAKNESVRLEAQQEISNRLWGKPRQSVDVDLGKLSIAGLMNEEDGDGV